MVAGCELYGDIRYTEYIGTRHPGTAGTHTASKNTDNKGNTYIISKHYTSKWPNAGLAMELTDRQLKYDLYLRVDHKDRSDNEWADQLANQDDTGFDPKKRWVPTAPMEVFNIVYELATALKLDKSKELKQEEFLRDRREGRHHTTHDTKRYKEATTTPRVLLRTREECEGERRGPHEHLGTTKWIRKEPTKWVKRRDETTRYGTTRHDGTRHGNTTHASSTT